jgi:hypothetical protein
MKKEGFCRIHKVQMREKQNEWGDFYYSHKVKGQWCYGHYEKHPIFKTSDGATNWPKKFKLKVNPQ